MADDRTEKATPKRREKSRDEGQVSKSQDLTAAITLSTSFAILFAYIPYVFVRLQTITVKTLSNLNPNLVDRDDLPGFFAPFIQEMSIILLPVMFVMVISGVAINVYQVGPMFSPKAIQPKFSKISPSAILKGFGKFFKMKSIVELIKSTLKCLVIGWIGYSVIGENKTVLLSLLGSDVMTAMDVFKVVLGEIILKICLFLLILGIIDKKYQDYEFEKSIKMTKNDVKDERKNADGDPKVKAKIRGIQMQFATQRMMGAVPTADVIVTNPTHYAIALKYDTNKSMAPQVVAKGVDFIAFKIREIAENNNVPIVENKPLARTLYKIVPIDGMIPAELYVAVAEVLAYVFRTNKGKY